MLKLSVIVLKMVTLLYHGSDAKHTLHTTRKDVKSPRIKVIAKPHEEIKI